MALPVIIMLSASIGAFLWLAFGLPGLVSFTASVAEYCQSVFVRCVEYTYLLEAVFLWAGAAVIAGGILYGISRNGAGLIRAHLKARGLPVAIKGRVALIKDPSSMAAFTHGLIRPRIYIGMGLVNALSNEELKGVFLHELHHMRLRDPARVFLLRFLKDSFFYLPIVGHIASFTRLRMEHEADRSASVAMDEPVSLASALLKVTALNSGLCPASMPASITGNEETPVAGRITSLIEGKEARFIMPSSRTMLASLLAASVLTLSLAWPIGAAMDIKKECSTRRCELHKDALGKDCRTHCSAKVHAHPH